ncbi:MAG TPA: 3D domain-containing protein, partial [Clostridiaceae bacterium]|nr:3D domain-containing protein [Clostridiaceae bacterium]
TLFIAMALIAASVAVFSTMKQITIAVDGKAHKVTTFSSSYAEVLESENIKVGPKDKAAPGLDSKVENGSTLNITRAVNVKVAVDGTSLAFESAAANVGEMLAAEGVNIADQDKVTPAKDSKLQDGLEISVVRVNTTDITEVSPLDFSTAYKTDGSILKGIKKVVQEGQAGEKSTVFKVTYENGEEVSRTLASSTVTKEPVEKIVATGTSVAVASSSSSSTAVSRGGDFSASKVLNMKSTAYSSLETGSNITASGAVTVRNTSGYSTIAVDPSVIPLGTKVYVEGYGYAIAQDTGGAIKGNIIDVYYDNMSEVNAWGVKYVNVYILE